MDSFNIKKHFFFWLRQLFLHLVISSEGNGDHNFLSKWVEV